MNNTAISHPMTSLACLSWKLGKNKILAYPGRSLGKPSEIVENPMFTRSLTSDLDLQEVRFRSLTSALVLHQGGPTFCRAANAYIGTDVCKVAFFRIEAMDGQLVFRAKNIKRSSPQSNQTPCAEATHEVTHPVGYFARQGLNPRSSPPGGLLRGGGAWDKSQLTNDRLPVYK